MFTPASSMQPSLRISWEGDAHRVDLRLEGRLGAGSVHRVDDAVAGALLSGHREVTLDASGLDHVDEACRGRLRRVLERWREPDVVLTLLLGSR